MPDTQGAGGPDDRVVRVTLPDGSKVWVDDLPVDDIIALAQQCDTGWRHITEVPTVGDGTVMRALYLLLCQRHGVPVPPKITAKQMARAFELVDDDRPTEYDVAESGFASPPPGDAPATT